MNDLGHLTPHHFKIRPGEYLGRRLFNRPGMAALLGAVVALFAQTAFNKIFEKVYDVVIERLEFPLDVAEIEYYRGIKDPCSPQVRNTIEQWNARVSHEHAANRQWFLVDWASSDKWNAVEPIVLHCETVPAPGFSLDQPLTFPERPAAAELHK